MVRGLTVPLIAALLSGAMPAAAQQFPFGAILQQMIPGAQPPPAAAPPAPYAPPAPAYAPPATAPAYAPSAAYPPAAPVSRLQEQAPSGQSSLGTDAVAVVEAIDGAPDAGLQFMDYVFSGQNVTLGPKGRLTLSHLSGCLVEEIHGGNVVVGASGSRVAGGRMHPKRDPNCKPPTPVIAAAATEAGATVNRVTPFSNQSWGERIVKRAQPVFRWDGGGRPVTVRVVDLDKAPAAIVWQGQSSGAFVEYPRNAAALVRGMPYRVEVWDGGQMRAAIFSVDVGLDVPDTLANRVIAIR
jgi:hypothetical protein